VHHELVPPEQSITGHFYLQVFQRFRDVVWKKWRDKWQGEWFLHHDNAPDHISLVVHQFLSGKNIPDTQKPYSSDHTPTDFWLFPTSKMGLKGASFASMENIK
jgi:hypothetical protein